MLLNDLLGNVGIDPARTLVLRHKPMESQLFRALPLIASERPQLFNVFQSYQGPSVERSMLALRGGWLTSFIAYGPAKAAFVGIYEIGDAEPHTREQFWAAPRTRPWPSMGTGDSPTPRRGRIRCVSISARPNISPIGAES